MCFSPRQCLKQYLAYHLVIFTRQVHAKINTVAKQLLFINGMVSKKILLVKNHSSH